LPTRKSAVCDRSQRDLDILHISDDLVAPPEWGAIEDGVDRVADTLEIYLRLDRCERVRRGLSAGAYDPQAGHRLVLGDPRVCKSRTLGNEKQCALMIVLNRSGSIRQGSPPKIEVAEALNSLAVNDDRRSLDASEVRFAMAYLGVDDIRHGITSTPRTVTMALLEATQWLIRSELAERADVSDRSLRDHPPDLLERGLIDEAPAGNRFNLSVTSDDRTSDRYPRYVGDPLRPEGHKAAKALRLGSQHHFEAPVAEDEFRSGIPSDTWCADLRDLADADTWIRDVLPLLWNLGCRDVSREDPDFAPLIAAGDTTEVRIGPAVQSQLAPYAEGPTG
jgi:hypothetical protein